MEEKIILKLFNVLMIKKKKKLQGIVSLYLQNIASNYKCSINRYSHCWNILYLLALL